jgi:hypothetical protein
MSAESVGTGVTLGAAVSLQGASPIESASAGLLGLPPIEAWGIVVGILIVAALLFWGLLRRGHRRGSSEDAFDSSGRPSR